MHNKTLERDQAYRAAFSESLVQENLNFYRSFLGLKAWPLSSPLCFDTERGWLTNNKFGLSELLKANFINSLFFKNPSKFNLIGQIESE